MLASARTELHFEAWALPLDVLVEVVLLVLVVVDVALEVVLLVLVLLAVRFLFAAPLTVMVVVVVAVSVYIARLSTESIFAFWTAKAEHIFAIDGPQRFLVKVLMGRTTDRTIQEVFQAETVLWCLSRHRKTWLTSVSVSVAVCVFVKVATDVVVAVVVIVTVAVVPVIVCVRVATVVVVVLSNVSTAAHYQSARQKLQSHEFTSPSITYDGSCLEAGPCSARTYLVATVLV